MLTLAAAAVMTAGCSAPADDTDDRAAASSSSSTPAATSSAPAAALEEFDVAGACDRYCGPLQAASTDAEARVTDWAAMVDDVQRILPPDSAYAALQDDIGAAQAAISDWRGSGCDQPQTGPAAELCTTQTLTVRFAVEAVGTRLSVAP